MPKVRRKMVPRTKAPKRPMPAVQPKVAATARRTEQPALAREDTRAVGGSRATQTAAFERIIRDALRRGWGFRLCLIGASGTGKTHFEQGLIFYALAVGAAELVLVYDHKDPAPGFKGLVLRSPAEYIEREPTPEDPPVVVFHEDSPGEPDDVASLGMQLAGAGVPTFTVIDELFPDAVTDGGQGFKNGNASPQALALRTGRSRRASIAFGTQIPQQMPTAIMDLCESQVVFRLQGRGLDYVERTRRIPPDAFSTVKSLGLGQCILISEGAWDGVIYGPDL